MAKFEKGHKSKGGRPVGAVNKTGAEVKEYIEACFDGIGGVKAFTAWAAKPKNRGEFYKIWSKLLPKDINVKTTDVTKSEPVPEFNSWIAGIVAARSADESKTTLPH